MHTPLRIAIAADHAGYHCKNHIGERLSQLGHTILDLGTDNARPVDYPEYGFAVGEAVASGKYDRGIVVCGSSIGISIAANKVPGIRCCPGLEPFSVELARRHNDVNVLALSERLTGWDMTQHLLDIFIDTPFEGGRHLGRVMKLNSYDHATRAHAQMAVDAGHVSNAETPAGELISSHR